MKYLLGFILCALMWYGLISFMMWDLSMLNWGWVARMFFVLLTLVTYKGYKDTLK
jgi:accessory gene regulator protein AgrB